MALELDLSGGQVIIADHLRGYFHWSLNVDMQDLCYVTITLPMWLAVKIGLSSRCQCDRNAIIITVLINVTQYSDDVYTFGLDTSPIWNYTFISRVYYS